LVLEFIKENTFQPLVGSNSNLTRFEFKSNSYTVAEKEHIIAPAQPVVGCRVVAS
jgi:hypothetical protein